MKSSKRIRIQKDHLYAYDVQKLPLVFPYKIHDVILKDVAEFRYLGLCLRHDLNWSSRVHQVCNKAIRKLWTLRKTLSDAIPDEKTAYKMSPTTTYLRKPDIEQNNLKVIAWNKAPKFIYNAYPQMQSVSELGKRLD